MLLADHSLWHTGGESILWAAAVAASLGILSRLRPVKWLYRQLVGRPVTEWGEQVVGSVVDAKLTEHEGGLPIRESLEHLAAAQIELSRSTKVEREALTVRVQALHDCIDNRFSDTHARIERLGDYSREMLAEAVVTKGRLRQLYRALDVPTFEADSEGRFTYVNPAFCDLTGIPTEDALGEGWAEILWAEDRGRVFDLWQKSTSDGAEFGALFRVHNRLTGEVAEVRANAQALAGGDGGTIGWVGTLEPLGPMGTMGRRRRGSSVSVGMDPEVDDA